MAWGGEGDVVDVDTGVDAGQDDTVGEDDQGSGDQGNGDNRDDRDDRGDANVQASDASGDTTVAGDEIDSSAAGIVNDFTQDKAKDKDEDSLIAYDQYKGDPVYKSGDPSQSVTVGSRQATKDQEDAVGAYVMAVTSQVDTFSDYQKQSKARADYDYQKESSIEASQFDPVTGPKGYRGKLDFGGDVSLHGLRYGDQAAYLQDYTEGIRKGTIDPDAGTVRVSQSGYDQFEFNQEQRDARIMATERSNRAAAQERARLSVLEAEQKELADSATKYDETRASILNSNIDPVSKAIMATENSKRAQAQKHMRMSASAIDEMAALQRQIKEISTFKEGFWKGFRKQDNKTKRQVQELLLDYQAKFKDTLKRDADLNTRMINSQGFTMNTSGAQGLLGSLTGLPLMGISAIQGLFNSLGIAYHKTDTEKELEALMMEWGLMEKPRSDLSSEERKALCERKEGWEWDEDAQVCSMKSADRFSEENRFVPQY